MAKQNIGYIRHSESMSTQVQEQLVRSSSIVSDLNLVFKVEDGDGFLRPTLEKILDDVQTGQVATLVISSLDRLDEYCSTNEDFLSFFKIVTENRVRFLSVAEEIDSNEPASSFFLKTETAIAKAREVVRGERIKLSLKRVRDEGTNLGRPRTVNYSEILDLRSKGLSIQKIADVLHISRGTVLHCIKSSDVKT